MHALLPFPASRPHAGISGAGEMNVTLAYENLSAALWASETLANLFRKASDVTEPHLSPWNFSTLEDPSLCAKAMAAASASELIVIATTSESRVLPAAVEAWLRKCLALREAGSTAVAALFGPENFPDGADSPRLQTVQRLAEAAGCVFFAPAANEAVLTAV